MPHYGQGSVGGANTPPQCLTQWLGVLSFCGHCTEQSLDTFVKLSKRKRMCSGSHEELFVFVTTLHKKHKIYPNNVDNFLSTSSTDYILLKWTEQEQISGRRQKRRIGSFMWFYSFPIRITWGILVIAMATPFKIKHGCQWLFWLEWQNGILCQVE